MTATDSSTNRFETDLDQTPANHEALTPIDFLVRSALTHPARTAWVYGDRSATYAEMHDRCRRLASALRKHGVERGESVAIMAQNGPAILEAHFGVPMAGAVLNALNFRLDAASIAFMLGHAGTRVLIADREFTATMEEAVAQHGKPLHVIAIDDPDTDNETGFGDTTYEAFLEAGDSADEPVLPADEWNAVSLNYTSGTTGNPKGVVYHHRGAFLNGIGNGMSLGFSGETVNLWTLPMFHCNGWCHAWGVTAFAGTHILLRKVDSKAIFRLIDEHRVTHMAGAPIVLNMILNAPDEHKRTFPQTVTISTGGAAPPSAVIAGMEALGFRVIHLYGLTETYGPALIASCQDDWMDMSVEDRAQAMSRQGLRHPMVAGHMVADPDTMQPVPADGETIGEIMLRGNTVMKGYLSNPDQTRKDLAGGWFHSGDLGVMHPDGYIQVKDRSKDIIISGGENISSIEIEDMLFKHPAVMEAAVVARSDETWGETPCAFVTLKPGREATDPTDIIGFCRDNMAHFKVPKTIVYGPLPKTATGKIRKFALRDRANALGLDDADFDVNRR
ncbi:MAG: AMP-binding protein [Rhodospirillales bacterium]|nr:AMP-binding protein [Rhodospirillales bacterium]